MSGMGAASSRSRILTIRRNRSLSGEDEAQVVGDGGEDNIDGIALADLEMAAIEVSVGLHVTDHGLDG